MAMACAFSAAGASSSAVRASSWTTSISTASQRRKWAALRTSSASRDGMIVKCDWEDDVSREERSISRREVFSLATMSVLLLSADKAKAKDIPFFGIRKQLEKAEKAVETEVKELTKQGEKEFKAVSSSVKDAVTGIEVGASSVTGFSPVLQAGGVAGAELVAVLVAATVVNGLVSIPSK